MGKAMRTAFVTALMIVAATAWADEPKAPDTKATEATAQTPAAQPAAASETATAAVAPADKRVALKPPAGYKPKRINGEQVWCAKLVVLGSKFPKEDCRNEAELRELIRTRESMRTDMESRTRTCASNNGSCGMN
jgi:hypothetical protein